MPRKKPDFIIGIHNYCDRWCEHCEYTARCSVFDMCERGDRRLKRKGKDPRDMDVTLKEVERNMRLSMRLLYRGAKRFGIDMDQVAREAKEMPPRDRKKLDKHPLAKAAMAYFKDVRKFVDSVADGYNMTADDVNDRGRFMEVAGEAEGLARVRRAMEILSWDSSMVAVKTRRALGGLVNEFEDEPDPFHLQDAEATAALVLRLLDRDMQAFKTVYDWSKDHQDAALTQLVKTERLGRGIKKLLPGYVNHTFPPKVGGIDRPL